MFSVHLFASLVPPPAGRTLQHLYFGPTYKYGRG